jgi:UTP:GlnB (protein PII) uridylyltransferase
LNSVEIKSVDIGRIRAAADQYAAHLLATRPDVEEIVVFGSFERGNYAPGSDLDLFIVLREADRPVRDRIPSLMPASFPVGVDLFPFTRQEMLQVAPSSMLDAVAASRWRYARAEASWNSEQRGS